jgi:ferredoxin
MAQIKKLKTGNIYTVKTGFELIRAYQIDPSLPLKFGCCNGECGVCTIKVVEGQENLSRPTKREKLTLAEKKLISPPNRLACQCAILGDIVIE